MNRKATLLGQALQMLAPKPKKITVLKIQGGPVTYQGKSISDAEFKELQRTHRVKMIHIVPASQRQQ